MESATKKLKTVTVPQTEWLELVKIKNAASRFGICAEPSCDIVVCIRLHSSTKGKNKFVVDCHNCMYCNKTFCSEHIKVGNVVFDGAIAFACATCAISNRIN
jgi:hypothetical protein